MPSAMHENSPFQKGDISAKLIFLKKLWGGAFALPLDVMCVTLKSYGHQLTILLPTPGRFLVGAHACIAEVVECNYR